MHPGADLDYPNTWVYGLHNREDCSSNGTSFQCVVPPVIRTSLLTGTGTPGGAFSRDLNALWCPTCPQPARNPGPGVLVQAPLWYRDPLTTSNQTTTLSDAIEISLGP